MINKSPPLATLPLDLLENGGFSPATPPVNTVRPGTLKAPFASNHRSAVRVVVLGDIGQPVYHVGDEAMTHAVVDELRARGVSDIVLLSRDPEQSTRIFGTSSVKTLEFPWPPHRRETYLREIRAILAGDMTALPR